MLAWFAPGLVSAMLGLYVIREAQVTNVTVDDYALTQRTVFSTRSIPLKELEGYREGGKDSFRLIPKQGRSLQLTTAIADRRELIEWVKDNYPDIDKREREAEEATLLRNERFGATQSEREATLVKARQFTRIANIGGMALGLWFVFYPQPFDLSLTLIFLAPLVALVMIRRFRGLIRFYSVKSSPYPSLGMMIGFTAGGGAVRAGMAYNLYEFPSSAWLLLLAGAAGMLLLIFLLAREAFTGEKRKSLVIIGVAVAALAYSYGLLVNTNCHYDRSTARVLPVAVTGKRASHGKSTTYYLQLAPWGRFPEGREVDVSKSFYNNIQPRDTVLVLLNQGRWDIPWFRLVSY
ncbi:MAG TPA: hypothetical protein VKQ52_11660 [Puia sp.]|nr:hypothetical protein [Puia sp.]